MRPRIDGATLLALSMLSAAACAPPRDGGPSATPPPEPRVYRMGFSLDSPPLPTLDRYLRRLELWAQRADGSITHSDVPWSRLLQGEDPAAIVADGLVEPISLMRSKGLAIALTLEPLDGLDRASEAPALREAGRSLTEPTVQRLYHDYALEVARRVRPDFLGLAAEVNLFRAQGSPQVYQALTRMVRDTLTGIRAAEPRLPLYVSLQVETAWGRDGSGGGYRGTAQAVADFPGIDMLGLSTYPLIGWDVPESIPDDYFERLLTQARLPGLVSESGWPSSFLPKATSPEMQARWIRRLAQLSDRAGVHFVGQLLFSDFDASIPVPPTSILPFFASQGLVDADFNPKPALAEWDQVFKRPRR